METFYAYVQSDERFSGCIVRYQPRPGPESTFAAVRRLARAALSPAAGEEIVVEWVPPEVTVRHIHNLYF